MARLVCPERFVRASSIRLFQQARSFIVLILKWILHLALHAGKTLGNSWRISRDVQFWCAENVCEYHSTLSYSGRTCALFGYMIGGMYGMLFKLTSIWVDMQEKGDGMILICLLVQSTCLRSLETKCNCGIITRKSFREPWIDLFKKIMRTILAHILV